MRIGTTDVQSSSFLLNMYILHDTKFMSNLCTVSNFRRRYFWETNGSHKEA
jgi:hypothetical protein